MILILKIIAMNMTIEIVTAATANMTEGAVAVDKIIYF